MEGILEKMERRKEGITETFLYSRSFSLLESTVLKIDSLVKKSHSWPGTRSNMVLEQWSGSDYGTY